VNRVLAQGGLRIRAKASNCGRSCIDRLCLYIERERTTMFPCEREGSRPGWRGTSRVCNYPLESHTFSRKLGKRRAEGTRRARRALPNLLATHFLVCLRTRLFSRGCAGPHAGFFCDDTEKELVAPRRS